MVTDDSRDYALHDLANALADCSDTPLLDARFFLADIKSCAIAEVYGQIRLSKAQMALFQSMCQRRQRHEPVAYILGKVAFWDMVLTVDSSVLIPRPDTEVLVSSLLARHANHDCACLEFGVGSGAISLAIARARSQWRVDGIDCSDDAVALAEKNRSACGVSEDQVVFYQDSWWSLRSTVATKQYALIVSNPPYIAKNSPDVCPDVRRYEPVIALFSEDGGLADLRQIIEVSWLRLCTNGWLYLEHGFDQAQQVQSLLIARGFSHIETLQDYAGHDRVTFACKVLNEVDI